MHTPDMIADLALMLLSAGVITILFKRIKQPLILGYILAGFLISPYFPMFFNVEDMDSINLWSEIGVIILMFHIGLEFNLHKLARMGGTAIVSALIKMAGVMVIGFLAGKLMGFSQINCIFLGGMLSISSTAVIQKSFEEIGIKQEKYSQLVMGELVIEDIVGIFMLVVLSTISVSRNVEGSELAVQLFMMVCYLIVWLILGIYFLPTFLNKVINLMNDEMLVVLSIGLCFGMVLIANKLGFSSELGAFLAGSLLAGTVHVERVEHITKGIKDMFVSFFFLSVGMMVNPHVIVEYAPMIILITVIAVSAKLIFATIGMLMSGQTLETAVKSGFSLAPIGEFSFIIATLGVNLGVMEEYLYPIIVSAAVLTTFITPFLIKKSVPVTDWLYKVLPDRLIAFLDKYTSSEQDENDSDNDWNEYTRLYFSRLVIYGVIMLMITIAGVQGLAPLLVKYISSPLSKLIVCVLIYFGISIFVSPMMNFHNALFTSLWLKKKSNRIPLMVFTTLKLFVIAAIAMIPLKWMLHIHVGILFVIAVVAVLLIARSGFMSASYLRMETHFLRNLNERIIEEEELRGRRQSWLDEELQIISLVIPEDAFFVGKSLDELQWGRVFNVQVVKVRHHGKHIILPDPKRHLAAGDKIFVIGDPKSIENFYRLIQIPPTRIPRTLKEFMDSDYPDAENALAFCAIRLTGSEDFAGKTIKNGNILRKWHCMILGIQQGGYPIVMPDINTYLKKDDIIWIMGSNNHIGRMLAQYVPEGAFCECNCAAEK